MRLRFAVVALLVAGALAGCVADDAPDAGSAGAAPGPADASGSNGTADDAGGEAEQGARVVPFNVTASDGTTLRGNVHLPPGNGTYAPVLELTPYVDPAQDAAGLNFSNSDEHPDHSGSYQALHDAGFAIARVSIRGTGQSEGCMQWGSPTARSDAYTVVEALANASWSNGNVGMLGLSYYGWTQYMAMAEAPPSLEAVVPVSGVIDLWSLVTRRGAAITPTPILDPVWKGAFSAVPAAAWGEPSHLTCPSYAEHQRGYNQVLVHGDPGPFYQERDLRPHIDGTTIPTFATNGLGPSEGHILQFRGLWDMLEGDKRMLLGQWDHDWPDTCEGSNPACRPGFTDAVVAWFDHYLRDGPDVETGFVRYQDDAMNWHEAERWPPAADETALHLSGDRLVADPGSVEASSQTFQSGGPQDDTGTEACGPDEAVYVSPPLQEDVLLAGNVTARLTLESTQPDGNLAVRLYHVDGEPNCQDENLSFVAPALADLRHVRTRQGETFPVAEPTEVPMHSYPHADVVPAGHRLVLAVAGDHPDLAPDPGQPTITVHAGPDTASQLDLPVVEGALSFEGSGSSGGAQAPAGSAPGG